MRKAKIQLIERLDAMHKEEPGTRDVIRIITDLGQGQMNSFYIEPVDKNKVPLKIISDDRANLTNDPDTMKEGDEVVYDKQNFLSKCVLWNDRQFRQRGYSFDFYSKSLYTG
jgi:hypothetical protein